MLSKYPVSDNAGVISQAQDKGNPLNQIGKYLLYPADKM